MLNFEGFRNLVLRIAREWYDVALAEYKTEFKAIHQYLQVTTVVNSP